MSDEKKTQSNDSRGGFKGKGQGGPKRGFGKGGFKSGDKGKGPRSGGFKGGKPAWKRDGEGSERGEKRFGDKPAWKKDGAKGGKPAWKRDGEGKSGEGRSGKRFGDKPAWKKDGEKRFSRDGESKRRDGFKKEGFRKDGNRKPFKKEHAVDENEVRDQKPARQFSERADRFGNDVREKRGDRYLNSHSRLKSKKERDAMELSREDDFVYSGDHKMSKKAMEGIFVEIGEMVTHQTYGEGVVRKVTGGKVGVEFEGKYRWFAFPSCIENGTLVQGRPEVAEPATDDPAEDEVVEVEEDKAVEEALEELDD